MNDDQQTIRTELPSGTSWEGAGPSNAPAGIQPTQRVGTSGRGGGPAFDSSSGANATMVLRTGPPSFAWLVVVNGQWQGHLYRIEPQGTMIGRDAQNAIILDGDDAVSGIHAKVRTEGDVEGKPQYFIQDLASTNGTKVNGEEIIKHQLVDGDRIAIGETMMIFKQV